MELTLYKRDTVSYNSEEEKEKEEEEEEEGRTEEEEQPTLTFITVEDTKEDGQESLPSEMTKEEKIDNSTDERRMERTNKSNTVMKEKTGEGKCEKEKTEEGKCEKEKTEERKCEKEKTEEGKCEKEKTEEGKCEKEKTEERKCEKEKTEERKCEKKKTEEGKCEKKDMYLHFTMDTTHRPEDRVYISSYGEQVDRFCTAVHLYCSVLHCTVLYCTVLYSANSTYIN